MEVIREDMRACELNEDMIMDGQELRIKCKKHMSTQLK